MGHEAALKDFLESRRARLSPTTVGIHATTTVRRVPGLRREEVAQLAGVSPDYYSRLEQGRARNVSDGVVTAISRALRLDPVETHHFRNLVHPVPPHHHREQVALVAPRLPGFIAALEPLPALVLSPRFEVLAQNRVAAALLTDFEALPVARRNLLLWMLESADRLPDREAALGTFVAILRREVSRDMCDPRVPRVLHLLEEHPDFAPIWRRHEVTDAVGGSLPIRADDEVLDLEWELLDTPGAEVQHVLVLTAVPGTAAAVRFGAERGEPASV